MNAVEYIPNNNILMGLGDLLDGTQKAWIRNSLIPKSLACQIAKIESLSESEAQSLTL